MNEKKLGLTEEALRAKHDVMFQIRQAVKTLQKGVFVPDAEFREHVARVPVQVYKSRAEQPEFSEYRGRAGTKEGGVTYWGRPEDINKLKADGVLS